MARQFKPVAESWRYILRGDRDLPPEQQTTFVLSPLSQAEMMAVDDAITRTVIDRAGGATVMSRMKQTSRELALAHIVSIENFPVGKPKVWPDDAQLRSAYLAELHIDDVHEIGNEIFSHSKIGADATIVGNSSAPERTSNSGATSGETTHARTG